jgi:hypothetical protein
MWRAFACQNFLSEKDGISGFLSWTQRTLRCYIWEPSGTVVKGQGSPELISDYGAQRVIRPRCIETIRVQTQYKSIYLCMHTPEYNFNMSKSA